MQPTQHRPDGPAAGGLSSATRASVNSVADSRLACTASASAAAAGPNHLEAHHNQLHSKRAQLSQGTRRGHDCATGSGGDLSAAKAHETNASQPSASAPLQQLRLARHPDESQLALARAHQASRQRPSRQLQPRSAMSATDTDTKCNEDVHHRRVRTNELVDGADESGRPHDRLASGSTTNASAELSNRHTDHQMNRAHEATQQHVHHQATEPGAATVPIIRVGRRHASSPASHHRVAVLVAAVCVTTLVQWTLSEAAPPEQDRAGPVARIRLAKQLIDIHQHSQLLKHMLDRAAAAGRQQQQYQGPVVAAATATTPTLDKQLVWPPQPPGAAPMYELGLATTSALQLDLPMAHEGPYKDHHHQVQAEFAAAAGEQQQTGAGQLHSHWQIQNDHQTGPPGAAHESAAESFPGRPQSGTEYESRRQPALLDGDGRSSAASSSGDTTKMRDSRSMFATGGSAPAGLPEQGSPRSVGADLAGGQQAAPGLRSSSSTGNGGQPSDFSGREADSKHDADENSERTQLTKTPIEPRQRRRIFNRILKKAEWNHLFLELSKVFLRYFLDLALKDIIGKQSGSGAADSSTTGRKKLDAQSELTDMLKEFVKTAISNI
jgi:hypothetical protein